MTASLFTLGQTTNAGSTEGFVLQEALRTMADEMYTNAKKLTGTGIVGSNGSMIDTSTETYIGQSRFFKPYSTQTVNVASLDNNADGNKQSYTSDFLRYAKTVRTHGAQEMNVQRVISQMDGLAKIARDFGEVRAQDEHDTILNTLIGVAANEAAVGAGFTSFTNYEETLDSDGRGFYVDMNAAGEFGAAVNTGTGRGLIRDAYSGADPVAGYGAVLGDRLFTALSLAYADYEPDSIYMVTSPQIMSQLRAANLTDRVKVTEGNMEFETIFGGKFRLILTRANQGNQSSATAVSAVSTQTTFLVKPGAVEMAMLNVPMPVEMYRDANKGNGAGLTDIWYRWGYIAHPMGYDWTGPTNAFVAAGTGTGSYGNAASWARKFDKLNLGILPIFHS